SSELFMLAKKLEVISEQNRLSHDYTFQSLWIALRDVLACFPVYRSYIQPDFPIEDEDLRWVKSTIRLTKRLNPIMSPAVYDFIEDILLMHDPKGLSDSEINARRDFLLNFQQTTAPVMAKGMEDTALYRMYPLASLNEVGTDLYSFGITAKVFHQ